MNGHAAPEQTPQDVQKRANQQLDDILRPIIGNTINGTLLTLQGVQPEQIVAAIARVTGETLGRIMHQGTLVGVLQIRAKMKEGFAASMDSVKPAPPPAGNLNERPKV